MSPSTPEAGVPTPGGRIAGRFLQRWRSTSLLLRREGPWDGRQSWSSFEHWCQAHPKRRCTLWLSSHLLHELVCDADLPLRDDHAVLAWAQPQLQHYHGEAAAAWPLAAWQQGRQRGVSVLHGVSLQAVQATAAQHGVRLVAVRPWWSLVLPLALRRHQALRGAQARLLVVEGDGVAALALRRGQVSGLALRRLDAATAPALAEWLAEQPGAVGSAVAIGYGLGAGPVAGLQAAEGLAAAAPASRWLNGAPS